MSKQKKVRRPLVLLTAKHPIIEKLVRSQELHRQLLEISTVDFGFRYCHRYCMENIKPESRELNFRIIHFDPASTCPYWQNFVESLSKNKRAIVINAPTSELKMEHFLEALATLRQKFRF